MHERCLTHSPFTYRTCKTPERGTLVAMVRMTIREDCTMPAEKNILKKLKEAKMKQELTHSEELIKKTSQV